MAGENFANFFITFEPVLEEARMKNIVKKVDEATKDLFNKTATAGQKAAKTYEQAAQKAAKKIAKTSDEGSNKVEKDVNKVGKAFNENLSGVFKKMTRISKLALLMSSVMGGLALLQNSQIYELDNNIKSLGEDSKEAYKYMSAANKLVGVSREGVADELNNILKSKQKRVATGEDDRTNLAMFGATIDESMDSIMLKFRDKIKSMPDADAKVFAEKLGLSNVAEIAKLDDARFKELTHSYLFQKQNIERMKKTAEATKSLLSSIGDVKDTMIVNFSPVVVGVLQTIADFFKSSLVEGVIQSIGGLVEDIKKVNDMLNGLPLKSLIAAIGEVIVYLSPLKLIHAKILILIAVIQDLFRAISGTKLGKFFGMKDRSETSLIGHYITNKIPSIRRQQELYDTGDRSNAIRAISNVVNNNSSANMQEYKIIKSAVKEQGVANRMDALRNINNNQKNNNNIKVDVNVSNTNASPREIGEVTATKINEALTSKNRLLNIGSDY